MKETNIETRLKTRKKYTIQNKTKKHRGGKDKTIGNHKTSSKDKTRGKHKTFLRLQSKTNRIPFLTTDSSINNKSIVTQSYNPTINQQLVSFKSLRRQTVKECENTNAFLLKQPLQIMISNRCYPYTDKKAQTYLLNNLRANKHVDVENIITPVQSHSNCWFNSMFLVFFISDKGRKFFHFFRQLMIEGKQGSGVKIPSKLWNAFAILNFAIECCLTGDDYAYELNTNSIIRQIYMSIPDSYKKSDKYLVDVDFASNPVFYYETLMNYLQSNPLERIIIEAKDEDWETQIESKVTTPPHYIVIEIFEQPNRIIRNKKQVLEFNGYRYELDSAIVRDKKENHFCAVLTCEGKEMAYDGASFHRLVPMEWKKNINKDVTWGFEGSNYPDNSPLEWSFLHGYQMLFYYRTK